MSRAGVVIYGRLTGDAGTRALLGQRIYPLRAPAKTETPYLAYQLVSSDRVQRGVAQGNLSRSRCQLSIWAASYAQVHAVADEVSRVLARFSGLVDGIAVRDCLPQGRQDLVDEDGQLFGVALDFRLVIGERA